MSQRTSEAARAIRKAWRNELDLVRTGRGTRDWTPEQQKDIVVYGKAYDEDGKAFQGHHMVSVEKNPDFQGCSDNIQFLSPKEHLEAHGGDFKNPTNGYYDYSTGKTIEFTDSGYESCKVINLSEPATVITKKIDQDEINCVESKAPECETGPPKKEGSSNEKAKSVRLYVVQSSTMEEFNEKHNSLFQKTITDNGQKQQEEKPQYRHKTVAAKKSGSTILKLIKDGGAFVGRKIWDNKGNIARWVLNTAAQVAQAYMEDKIFEMADSYDDGVDSESKSGEDTIKKERSDSAIVERASPVRHTVSAGGQHYWKNGEKVWIEKAPYQRGGRKEDESTEE